MYDSPREAFHEPIPPTLLTADKTEVISPVGAVDGGLHRLLVR